MSWQVEASHKNTHQFGEFIVRKDGEEIALANGFIAQDNPSVLSLNELHSFVNGNGYGTLVLLNMVVWAKKNGAFELGGDFHPTGDRDQIIRWYLNRGIKIVNGGYDLSGYIPHVILACTSRLALFK